MSDLQRDIALVQATIASGAESTAPFEAWRRILARLTPDRERVARALVLCETVLDERGEPRDTLDYWREMADAAIAAMGETP